MASCMMLKFITFESLPCWKSIHYYSKLTIYPSEINHLGGIFDFDSKCERLDEVLRELENPNVWQNPDRAQSLGKERAQLEATVSTIQRLSQGIQDAQDLLDIARQENDELAIAEIAKDLNGLEGRLADMEFQRMFAGEMDANNAFLDIQAGAGGTEAQDWASMLLRMYLRWGEHKGFHTETLEYSSGEVAGIKSVTVKFSGPYAYGWLRTESGIHRLVRKSPFNADNKRHTSFASVFVSPEVDDNIEVDIDPADLRIDTYRASGAGGQHVNRTDSAIRITHLPSGIVVQCQSDRSQHKNRAQAMSQLKAKLYELEMKKRNAEKQALEDTKTDVGWGHQIRSYVLDDGRVKDLRTGIETGKTQAVLDGEIDLFIEASLKMGMAQKGE